MSDGDSRWTYKYCSFSFQDAETTDECAARLKAGAPSSESTDDGWKGLDRLVCVDSTWQQSTGIMKVGAQRRYIQNHYYCDFCAYPAVCW